MPFVAWMSLEDFKLSEISQIQKDKYYMIHLFEDPGIVRLKEGESRMVVAGIWRERSEEILNKGYKVLAIQDKEVLEIYCRA